MAGRGPDESDTCRDYVRPRLLQAGWSDEQISEQHRVTDGRIVPVGKRHQRAEPLVADYVLEFRPGLPVAVVEAKRLYAKPGKGMQQAKQYGEMLDLPLAYSTNGKGIVEDDRDTGLETENVEFPSPTEAWRRYQAWKGIDDPAVAEALVLPFNRVLRTADGSVKEPRYYQQVAINRTVDAVMSGRDRILLTMATGTGKTFTSMQIVWKLAQSRWRSDRKPRILYLADRNVLVDQPITSDFKPVFGDAVWKFDGEIKHGREIYFGLYQNLGDTGGETDGVFRDIAPDFFDLIIVDECHRGSSNPDSSWRGILEHFSPATQLGMTATPRRDENADTYDYFGDAIFEYSLAQGIEDGFLAPYRVRRVVLSPDALGWSPSPGEVDRFGKDIPDGVYTSNEFERIVSLLARTDLAARHLTDHLARTDRTAQTLVFCRDQEHADQMRRALNNLNNDISRAHPDYVVRITSDEGAIGRGFLDRMTDADEDYPVIATTSQMLSTGVDLPRVRNVVIFRPIGSVELFKQIIGRGTRLYPDDDKLSFDIIDYSGASALFEDRGFDGPPERIDEDTIDADGVLVAEEVVEEPAPAFDDSVDIAADQVDVDDLPPFEKLYVDGGEFYVTAEAFYELDPTTGRVRLVEYRSHVVDSVRALVPSAKKLRRAWSDEERRADIRRRLEGRGIDLDTLGVRMGMPEADPVDLLVHLAWNKPLRTRAERARRVRKEHAAFFEQYDEAAREVLEELLHRYAQSGTDELDDLEATLSVPPLDARTRTETARLFGGGQGLRGAVSELKRYLYAA